MTDTPSTVLTSNYAGSFIAHETDESFDCRAACLQSFETGEGHKTRMLSMTFNNRAGLGESMNRSLRFVDKAITPEEGSITVHLNGEDMIIVGLKALFKQTKPGWSDYEVSKPIISRAMQDAIIGACSDFMAHSDNLPAPDEL